MSYEEIGDEGYCVDRKRGELIPHENRNGTRSESS
jgi:hypothetical protein